MLNFQTLFESIPGLYIVYDLDFVIVGGSDAYFQATKTKREEAVGRHLFEVFPDNPDDPNADGVRNLRASLESVLKHRQPHTMAVQKYDIRRPESEGGGFEERYWTPVNSPLFDENGEMTHIIHRAEDVTEFVRVQQQRNEQRQLNQVLQSRSEQMEMEIYARAQELQALNEQLQAANEALSELDRAKTAFFSNVSHEFRTPLTLVLSPLEDLSNRLNGRLQSDEREQLHLIQRNGLRLQKLVNTLLDFSRIEAGRIQATYEPTDLATFTAELASVFRSLIEQAGMTLVVDCPALPELVYVDRDMWEKIVLNLLSNAFKFTLAGTIAVRLRWIESAVELSVADTGVGIPPEELPHLFERFHRVENSQGRSFEGSGIGLSLVQELVKLHGGAIEVSSRFGQGSCFTVAIPTGTAHLPKAQIGASRTLASTALGAIPYVEEAQRWLATDGKTDGADGLPVEGERVLRPIDLVSAASATTAAARILLADDNADMRDYIRRLLNGAYTVDTVADGAAAWAAIQNNLPDLVLTDVMMPRMDGIELLQLLRSHPQTQATPIILLSARAGEAARLEGLAAGADDYLIKPFSARELLARVEATLKLSKLRREALQQEQTLRVESVTAQQKAEAALRRTDQLLESMSEAFIALDQDWRIIYQNAAAEQINNKPRSEVLGKTLWEEWPAAVGSISDRQYRHAIAEQVAVHFEQHYYEPPDHDVWLEVHAYPFEEGLGIFYRDISDRKRVEAALREGEERTRNILESIAEAFFALDENWRFTYVNQSVGALLDRTPDDLIGKNIWEDYPGMISSEFEQIYWSAMRDRVAASLTAFYPDHERWYEVRTYPAPNGITVYFRNVTEQIQTAATLRQSEERYRTLFESIDEGFCVVEVLCNAHNTPIDYRVLEVNPAFEQQTGLQQAVGKTARQLNLEEHWIELYGQVALTGESVRFENGSKTLNRWFDVYACRMGEPEARKVAIVFKDISERKRTEEILRQSAELDAFRVSLTDTLRPLADPVEIQATASRVLGEYLGANRVVYFEISGADYIVERDYVNGADALAGRYPIDSFGSKLIAAYRTGRAVLASDVSADPNLSPDQQSAYAAIQIAAYIGIPLIKQGEFVAGLAVHTSEPRVWTPDEVNLVEEVAERTWAAVDRARAEAVVVANLQDTQLLRELGTRLVTESDIQTLYQEIMSAAIALTRADAGTVQILDETTQELVLLATYGFERTLTEHFYRVTARSNTSCGIALTTGERTFIDFDVPESEDPDGSLRMHVEAGYFSGQSTPLSTRSGKPIGMVSTHWRNPHRPNDRELRFLDLLARQAADLIEQRQTAAEREQLLAREQAAREAADRANRIKDEFLAVLSHELRSPLNPILGWSKLLQQGKLDAAKTTTALMTIERNARLQVQLIDDLLDISRILRGKLSLTMMPVDLSTVISEALETVRLAAEAKSIPIQMAVLPGVGVVIGDAGRLQQVVWNLLSNAVKFTPAGGRVEVRLEQAMGNRSLVMGKEPDQQPITDYRLPITDYAQLQVTDTGKGIKSDFLPYVFDHFRQEDGATTRKFGGLGLGLAIVRQIVEMHGGTVTVDSPGEGQGATFTVQIPLAPQSIELPSPQPASALTGDLSGIRILIVDDESDSREFVAFVLEQAGAIVTSVASGFDALPAVAQSIPDILISDIGMPQMDGYMLMRQIRSLPLEQGRQIPAIALTAYAGEIDQRQAIAAGFQQHITKPIDPAILTAAIVNLIKSIN